jgi:hypothetical protein
MRKALLALALIAAGFATTGCAHGHAYGGVDGGAHW